MGRQLNLLQRLSELPLNVPFFLKTKSQKVRSHNLFMKNVTSTRHSNIKLEVRTCIIIKKAYVSIFMSSYCDRQGWVAHYTIYLIVHTWLCNDIKDFFLKGPTTSTCQNLNTDKSRVFDRSFMTIMSISQMLF